MRRDIEEIQEKFHATCYSKLFSTSPRKMCWKR